MSGASTVKRQIEAFREAASGWRPEDTGEAMACRDLEDKLRVGIFLYEQIEATDRQWRLAMARGESKYEKAREDAIERDFAWWLAPCQFVEQRIKQFERKGYSVAGAKRFRLYYARAKGVAKENA